MLTFLLCVAERTFDVRLRVATIVFRAFLHQLELLALLPDFHLFWLKFVGSLERYMKPDATTPTAVKPGPTAPASSLAMHFTESLKNVLLVMHASGVFAEASKRSGQVTLFILFP